eukprot:5975080-Amphidinium_carterae.2
MFHCHWHPKRKTEGQPYRQKLLFDAVCEGDQMRPIFSVLVVCEVILTAPRSWPRAVALKNRHPRWKPAQHSWQERHSLNLSLKAYNFDRDFLSFLQQLYLRLVSDKNNATGDHWK